MIYVEVKTFIRRPIEEVFDRLTDVDSYSEWLPKSKVFLDCRQKSDGPLRLGTTFVDETRIGTYHGEVTDFQRPTKVSFRMRLRWLGIAVMESRPTYLLEMVDDGTDVHHIAEGELYGIFRLMESYVADEAERERKRTIEVLRKSLAVSSR